MQQLSDTIKKFLDHPQGLPCHYSHWLSQADIPKLFINAEPGVLIAGEAEDLVRSWPNITEVTVPGLHFIQEDSPDLIGGAIASWLDHVES